jgi:hypothetical protein
MGLGAGGLAQLRHESARDSVEAEGLARSTSWRLANFGIGTFHFINQFQSIINHQQVNKCKHTAWPPSVVLTREASCARLRRRGGCDRRTHADLTTAECPRAAAARPNQYVWCAVVRWCVCRLPCVVCRVVSCVVHWADVGVRVQRGGSLRCWAPRGTSGGGTACAGSCTAT